MHKEPFCQISNKIDFTISRIILCKLHNQNGINKIEYLESKMYQKKEIIIEKDLKVNIYYIVNYQI